MVTKRKIISMKGKKMSVVPAAKPIYEKDFYKWTHSQASFLKKQEFSKLDIDNLIEEIESLGRSEKRTLRSYLEILLMHMLKVKFQPSMHTVSWDLSIKETSHKAQTTLQENPSLKMQLKDLVKDAYFSARIKAALETGLDEKTFPKKCPWVSKDLFPDLEKKYW